MGRQKYESWSPQDRADAWHDGDYEGCKKYDNDFESSERAFESWLNGGDFQDPDPDNRFS